MMLAILGEIAPYTLFDSFRFHWTVTTHIGKYVGHCVRCIRRRARDPPRAAMKSFIAKEPMELLAIDFLSLERGKGGFENILVVTDSFTNFSWAFPTPKPESYNNRQTPVGEVFR